MAKNALCIGINNYPGTHMDLQGCATDANDRAAALGGGGRTVPTLRGVGRRPCDRRLRRRHLSAGRRR